MSVEGGAENVGRLVEAVNKLIDDGCVSFACGGQLAPTCGGCKKKCAHTAAGAAAESAEAKSRINQEQLGEYVQSVRARMLLGVNGYTPYPYDKEKKLTYAIMTGDADAARMYLNEILGHIFFASASSLDAIKTRAMELTVVISRAAIDSGADANRIYQFNPEFIVKYFRSETVEEVCEALTAMLNSFTEEVFKPAQVKHLEIITKVISYMTNNYMHKITLEDVAEHIYLSPSYLSKVFKEEMKMPFSTYLNNVRIEKSKVLLLSEQLSVSEVADLAGFYDQSYFNKVFKKSVGVTPKKYREQKGSVIKDN